MSEIIHAPFTPEQVEGLIRDAGYAAVSTQHQLLDPIIGDPTRPQTRARQRESDADAAGQEQALGARASGQSDVQPEAPRDGSDVRLSSAVRAHTS